MSKGTRRYGKRSRSRGKRRNKKGGNILSRALVPAALYFSQKRLQRGKRKRSRKNRSRKRRGGYMRGGSPLSPSSYGSASGANSNLASANFEIKKGGKVLGGALGGNVNFKGKVDLSSKYLN